MGKRDALETAKLNLTLPNDLYVEICQTQVKDAISLQDKIRRLIVLGLKELKREVES